MLTMQECQEAAGTGRAVVYHAAPGTRGEQGVVTSTSGSYVFVRFDGDQASKACVPETLEWMVAR